MKRGRMMMMMRRVEAEGKMIVRRLGISRMETVGKDLRESRVIKLRKVYIYTTYKQKHQICLFHLCSFSQAKS